MPVPVIALLAALAAFAVWLAWQRKTPDVARCAGCGEPIAADRTWCAACLELRLAPFWSDVQATQDRDRVAELLRFLDE